MQQLKHIQKVWRKASNPLRIDTGFRRITLALLGWSMPLIAAAQSPIDDCKDCKNLNEVQVFGFSPERFMSGLKVQKVDSINLARFQYQTLADFLQFQTPVAIKSYGVGQASSISFRGTSANHTAVLWNGLNVNSPTLGQSDLSTIPLLGFDKMSIQYGSAASCVGSDAVGGSILLNSSPNFTTNATLNAVLGLQVGSFKNYNFNSGIRFNKSLKKGFIANKTLVYGSTLQNTFPYTLRTDRAGREYLIEPSETTQKGIVQDLYFRPQKGLYFINIWLTDNTLTIQPQVVDIREITQTQAYRFLGGYQSDAGLSFKAGFIRDILDYGKGAFTQPSQSATDRYILRGEHDFSPFKKLKNKEAISVRLGGEFVHYATKVDGYDTELIHENRGDIYALIRSVLSEKLTASINLRQALSSHYKVPFTPSLGLDFKLFANKITQVSLLGNVAKSYRLPTLNERYWKVLGNLNIKPENGLNKEIGIEWKQLYGNYIKSTVAINAFHNLINDWTYWNPDKNYRVENLQQVLSKGLELTSSLKYNDFVAKKAAGVILSYSLTNASQQKVYDIYAADIVGKQLIYVPRHAISSNVYYGIKNWNVGLQAMFNSARYITFDHSGQPFPPYMILNTTLNYKTKLLKYTETNIVFQGNNLSNTVYPNLKRNAMPGINFQIALIFNFIK